MISRRLFLGGLVPTAAGVVPLVRTFRHDADLEVCAALELQGEDILVVRGMEGMEAEEAEFIADILKEHVWPNVLLVPDGVEFEVLKRYTG